MVRNLLIALFLTGLSQLTMAQTTISLKGQVVELDNQEPLIGAQVYVNPTTGTVTNDDGQFEIALPEGEHTLRVSFLGYEQKEIEVNTNNPDLGVIPLALSITSLSEIIVSGSSENFKSDFKGSNFKISPIAIRNLNPLNTEEVLKTVPGVNIVGDMGLSNRPNISIRGSWGRRSKKVLLMEDGSPAAPAPYVAPGAYYNPVSDRLKSIEVYKGADMLRYGPNNMYGAVNYITALPPQQPELRVKLVGGQRSYTTGLFSYGGTWENLGALVETVYKSFDGFTQNSSVEVVNLNAKIFANIADNQSIYFKVSGQFEDNQASLSSQTPLTFELDPTQNPFDADQFTMRRYGVDIIHKWLPKTNMSFTSKIYASDFERDWWRQVTTKVLASEARSYLGDDIFNSRYGYLNGLTFGPEDYLRVGRVVNGRESTTDSRWAFTVSGFKETFKMDWAGWGGQHNLEVGFKLHQENYKDRTLAADSSRWARSGRTVRDLKYYLWSASGYVRNEFHFDKLGITPIFRIEHIDMYRQDLIAAAQNPNSTGLDSGREPNTYGVFLPGITVDYQTRSGEIFGSIYEGFIAPSKVFGFLVERDGIITNPLAGESINISPELSLNTEIGFRGSTFKDRLRGQVTYFNNTVRNFYAGGRNEVFEELGRINVQGLEVAFELELLNTLEHELKFHGNATLMRSKILEGQLNDRDLFSQVTHSAATRAEFIDKVNANRSAYTLYQADGQGNFQLITQETLTVADFNNIDKALMRFGEGNLEDTEVPYSPNLNLTLGMNYTYNDLSAGVSAHHVSTQFTEFNNFTSESADGAIGQLPSFVTVDAYVNYDFTLGNKTNLNVFLNGKNLGNNIFRVSRLNRATSGIFPGGFRQWIFGVNIGL